MLGPRASMLVGWVLFGILLLGLAVAFAVGTAFAASGQPAPAPVLVNEDEPFIERHGDGGFTARPVFDVRLDMLAYGVKDPADGSWLTALYRVQEQPRKVDAGWEYTIDYPEFDEQPALDPDRAYTLVLYAQHQSELRSFEQTVPIYEPDNLWDRVLRAFNPATWARAFAGWVVEAIHGVLCSVLERITGDELENCAS